MTASDVGLLTRATGATHALAAMCAGATHADVSQRSRHKAVLSLLDCLGVLLAAGGEPAAEVPAAVLAAVEGPGTASIIGHLGRRLSPPSAALVNGARAHALDFDDLHYPWYGHPTTVLFPALFALAEHLDLSGQRLVTAYSVGLAVGRALAESLNMRHYERGWHATATFGSLAAAGACSNLLGLSAAHTAHALGIAASEASGLRQNFGSPVKPLHAGLAARNGVLAALLAQAGLTADAAAIEGQLGFANVFGLADDARGLDRIDLVLAEGIDAAFGGLSLKQYPSCAATHPGLDAVLDIMREHHIKGTDVARIDCDVSPLLADILVWTRPRTGLQGKFSLEYCLAVAVQDGAAGLAQFTDSRASDPQLWAMMERVFKTVDTDNSVDPRGEFGTRVCVTLTNGQRYTRHPLCARGTPTMPLADNEVLTKFRACAAPHLGQARAERVLSTVLESDGPSSVRAIAFALHGGQTAV